MKMSFASLLVIAFLCLQAVPAASLVADGQAHGFEFHNVTVLVKDDAGNPVGMAFVKAFSPDWGIMYPHFEEWGIAGDDGSYRFSLPTGSWIFIASSGWDYAVTNLGKGLFLETTAYIDDDALIILKPHNAISFTILNETGENLPVDEMYTLLSNFIPAIPPAFVGIPANGFLTLYTNFKDCDLTVVAIKRPSYDSDGYILVKNLTTRHTDHIISSANTSKLLLTAYEPDGNLSIYWNVEFRLPELYLGHWAYSFQLTGKDIFHITPGNLVLNPRYTPPEGWYYYFESIALSLEANREQSYYFGGKGTFRFWVIKENTQLWFDFRDEFGNILAFYSDPMGERNITLRIFEEGREVYTDNLGKYIPGTLFFGIGRTFSDLATFELFIEIGPFGGLGNISTSGLLYDANRLVKFREMQSDSFIFHVPVEYFWNVSGQMRDRVFIYSLETVYRSMGDFLEEELQVIPHRAEVNLEWCGVGGTNFVGFGLGVARWPTHVHPGWLGVLSHELGHLYSFTPPLIYYVECPLFCESLATYLGIEAVASLYGHNVRLWYWGTHPGFFDYLADDDAVSEIERMQFIFFYLHRLYGSEIHRQFIRLWAGDTFLMRGLMDKGFDLNETMIILYSYLARENLAWLFQIAGYNVSEETVEKGLAVIESGIDFAEPWQAYDENEKNGKIETGELIKAIKDWLNDKLKTADLINVIRKWLEC